MSVTGLLHGATLSMTRLFFTPQGLSYVNKKAEMEPSGFTPPSRATDEGVFTSKDFEVLAVAVATIAGTIEDRVVFPDSGGLASRWEAAPAQHGPSSLDRM